MEDISIVFLDFSEYENIWNQHRGFNNLWDPLVNKYSMVPRIEKGLC